MNKRIPLFTKIAAMALMMLVALAVAPALNAADEKTPAGQSQPPATPVTPKGVAENGKALFAKNCVLCHKKTPEGDGLAAAAPNKNLLEKTYMASRTDENLLAVIKNGGAAAGKSPMMREFGSKLTDEEIRDLIAYIRGITK